MPWTLVQSLTPSIPVHTGTVRGNSGTIAVGDKDANDLYDVEISFADFTVTNNFAFRTNTLNNIEVVHISPDAANNKITVRLKTLNDGFSFGQLRFTFGDTLYESSPNVQVQIVDV